MASVSLLLFVSQPCFVLPLFLSLVNVGFLQYTLLNFIFFLSGQPSLTISSVYAPSQPVFPCGSAGKKSVCNVGDLGLIPGLGRSPGEGKGYPLKYFGLENSMDCV